MKKRFTAGVLLAIFTFLFLETEYLFVNIMSAFSSSQQAVSAQGIVLGVSVIGFVLYALFHRIKSAFVKRVVTVMFPLIMAVCLFFLYEADSYAICLLQAVLYLCCLDCLAVLCIIMHFFMLAEIRTWHF